MNHIAFLHTMESNHLDAFVKAVQKRDIDEVKKYLNMNVNLLLKLKAPGKSNDSPIGQVIKDLNGAAYLTSRHLEYLIDTFLSTPMLKDMRKEMGIQIEELQKNLDILNLMKDKIQI